MATAYELAFGYEIANECIAGINGFISRNYIANGREMSKEVKESYKELRDIYKKI